MKVNFTGAVDSLSGTLDNVVFVRLPSGKVYARKRPCNTHREVSEEQKQMLTFTAKASAHWSTLTQSQRDGWFEYARQHMGKDQWGEHKNPNAIAMYVKASATHQILGLPLISDPPSAGRPIPVFDIQAVESGDAVTVGLRLTHGIQNNELPDHVILVRMAPPPKTEARKFAPEQYRYICKLGPLSAKLLPASGGEVFFTPTRFEVGPGQRYGIEVRIARISDGIVSKPRVETFRRPA